MLLPLVVLTVLGLLVYAVKSPKVSMPKFSGVHFLHRDWMTRGFVKVILGFIILHLIVWVLIPTVYGKWFTALVFWQINAGIVLVAVLFAMFSQSTGVPAIHKVGVLLFGSLMIFTLWGQVGSTEKTTGWWPWSVASSPRTEERFSLRGFSDQLTPAGVDAVRLADHPYKVLCTEESDIEQIQAAFPADTVMWNIAAAESNCRQAVGDSVVTNRNTNETLDQGIFQINSIHEALADSLGIDVETLEGNLIMADTLKGRSAYQPWNASRSCWQDWTCGGTVVRVSETRTCTTRPTPGKIDTLIAPQSGLSPTCNIPSGWRIRIQQLDTVPILFVNERNREVVVHPDRCVDLGTFRTARFGSPVDRDVEVEMLWIPWNAPRDPGCR